MHIKEILSQNRRDFTAVFECEWCGYQLRDHGYDDSNFHQNVVPKMRCPKCGELASPHYHPRETKYPDWQEV